VNQRTPLWTEVKWFLAVVLVGGAIAAAFAGWIVWRVFVAGAGC
jgi:hypothetical protein